MAPGTGRLKLQSNIPALRWTSPIPQLIIIAHRYMQVIAVDISPHMQPVDVPDNLWLQVSPLFPLVFGTTRPSIRTRLEGPTIDSQPDYSAWNE